MLTLFDLDDNLRNEYANTPDVIQEDIRKKYSEDNLMFVMTGNRMNGCIENKKGVERMAKKQYNSYIMDIFQNDVEAIKTTEKDAIILH